MRIKCDYCISLAKLEKIEELKKIINPTIDLFDKNFNEEDKRKAASFFDNLLFHRMKISHDNKNYNQAKKDIDYLMKYHPDEENFKRWNESIEDKLGVAKSNNSYYKARKAKKYKDIGWVTLGIVIILFILELFAETDKFSPFIDILSFGSLSIYFYTYFKYKKIIKN